MKQGIICRNKERQSKRVVRFMLLGKETNHIFFATWISLLEICLRNSGLNGSIWMQNREMLGLLPSSGRMVIRFTTGWRSAIRKNWILMAEKFRSLNLLRLVIAVTPSRKILLPVLHWMAFSISTFGRCLVAVLLLLRPMEWYTLRKCMKCLPECCVPKWMVCHWLLPIWRNIWRIITLLFMKITMMVTVSYCRLRNLLLPEVWIWQVRFICQTVRRLPYRLKPE